MPDCHNWSKAPPLFKTQGPTNVGLHFHQPGQQALGILIKDVYRFKSIGSYWYCTEMTDNQYF